jgi:hypothetical protein
MTSLVLAALMAQQSTRVIGVSAETVQGRAALRVVTTSGASAVRVSRDAGALSFTLAGATGEGLRGPANPPPPLGAVQVLSAAEGVVVRIEVAMDVPYEVRREGSDLLVLFGARDRPAPNAEVLELYRRILPPPSGEAPGAAAGEAAEDTPTDAAVPAPSEPAGAFSLRPAVDAVYVDSKGTFLDTPEPVHDQYVEVFPRVNMDLDFARGRLTGSYGARLRRGSSFSATGGTTHLADASLSVPLGTRLTLRASDHFAHGLLETTEVDAGREYFFSLGRFTRNTLAGSLRAQIGGGRLTLDLDLGGSFDYLDIDDDAGFFDYERRSLGSGLRYAVNPALEARLVYAFEDVPPPPERPVAESRSHSASLVLEGEIVPLVTGLVSVGYRDQRAPQAAPEARRFTGVVGEVRLTKEFSRSARFSLLGTRATYVSGFEDNAFYVASEVGAELTVGLPASLALRGGATYHWNDYEAPAAGLDEPRADRLRGFTVGLGRPLTRWAYIRADYRKEFRDSNLEALDTETSAFTAQIGVGAFGGGGSRP